MNAQEELTEEIREAEILLAKVGKAIASLKNKTLIHWGDVGDANRIKSDLQEIVRYTRNLR